MHTAGRVFRPNLPDYPVDVRVGTEPQNIQITGGDKMPARLFILPLTHEASPHAISKLRIPVVYLRRRFILLNRFLPLTPFFLRDARIEIRFPLLQLLLRYTPTVLRPERRTVLQVHGDRRKDYRSSPLPAVAAYALKVPAEIAVHRFQPRIVRGYGIVQKHFHPAPLPRHLRGRTQNTRQPLHQLSRPHRFYPQVRPNHRQTRRPLLKYRRRSKWPDHLVVSHVNNKQIGLMPRAFPSNLPHYVRVDGRHRRVDNLKPFPRKPLPQHHFQDSPEAEPRSRHPVRRRSPQDEYPDRPFLLFPYGVRYRFPRQLFCKEPPSELAVGHIQTVPVRTEIEFSRIPETRQA